MGKEKHVVSYESNRAIGVKKSYVFYEGKRTRGGLRTQWIMREYRLLGSQTRPNSGLQQKFVREMEDWVVCKIYQKKRTSKKNVVETTKSNKIWSAREISPIVMDVVMVGSNDGLGPPQPSSSSCSSGVSFCKREPEEEIISAYNIN